MLKSFATAFLSLILYTLYFIPLSVSAVMLQRPPSHLGLVGYWTMDGNDISSTNLTDRSGNGYTGTISGAVPITGKIGQGLKFNGTTNYISAHSAATAVNKSAGTFSLWVNINGYNVQTTSLNPEIMSIGYSGSSANGISLYTGSVGRINISYRKDSVDISAGITGAMTNTWYHIVGTWDASNVIFYSNGELVQSTPQGSAITQAFDRFFIGSDALGTQNYYFNGKIDEVRVYNRALSATEIRKLYGAGQVRVNREGVTEVTVNASPTNKLTNGLVGYWTMDGNDINWRANTISDRSPVGTNTGTLVNMSTSTSPVRGILGQGLRFDNSNDYVSVTQSSSVNNLSALTLSVWTKANSYGQNNQGYIADKSDSGSTGWRFQNHNTNANVRFYVDYDGASDLLVGSASNSLTTSDWGKWVHWVLTWNGSSSASNVHIYKNGVETPSYASQTSGDGNRTTDAARNINIGGNGVSRTYNGSIDDFRIYNRVLTADEVKQLYNMGR